MKADFTIAFTKIQQKQLIDRYGLDKDGRTQKIVDSAFMGHVDKYMPMDDERKMITSMYNATKIGSGEINIDGPHAHYQHEGILYVDQKTGKGAFYDPISGRFWSRPDIKKIPSNRKLNYHGGALRGDHFIERMLADHFEDILKAGQEEIDNGK